MSNTPEEKSNECKTSANRGYIFLAVVWLSLNTHGSETNRIAGIRANTPAVHAFIHAQIVVEPGREVHNGTLVIRDGLIESVKENSAPPESAPRNPGFAGLAGVSGGVVLC